MRFVSDVRAYNPGEHFSKCLLSCRVMQAKNFDTENADGDNAQYRWPLLLFLGGRAMNIFNILGVNYEVFHSRMLLWLWSPNADHEVAAANEKVLRESESAIRDLVREFKIGTELTAVDLWSSFLQIYPDHAAALEGRWADSSHYSTKTWFAATLLRLARGRDLIEETGAWRTTDGSWGFPKVRVYRRISSTEEPFG
ncbi:MAG TPA: hypothetical protein VJ783_30210 [Pirellulales bacterium]|nr:hypothetical protein [Pirellulales bacterium]